MNFRNEFFFWIYAAVALTFFVIAFPPLFKIVVAHLPLPEGMQEALAVPA